MTESELQEIEKYYYSYLRFDQDIALTKLIAEIRRLKQSPSDAEVRSAARAGRRTGIFEQAYEDGFFIGVMWRESYTDKKEK